MSARMYYILLAIHDNSLMEGMKNYFEALKGHYVLLKVSNVDEGRKVLKKMFSTDNPDEGPDFVITDEFSGWQNLHHHILEYYPNSPFCVWGRETLPPDGFEEREGLDNWWSLEDGSYKKLENELMEKEIIESTNLPGEIFRSFPIYNFLRNNYTECDVFIKLSEIKFVKIINANAAYDLELFNKYFDKGAHSFFVPNKQVEECGEDTFLTYLPKEKEGPLIQSRKVVENLCLMLKIDPTFVDKARIDFAQCMKVLSKKRDTLLMIKDYVGRDEFMPDHSTMSAYLCCTMCDLMGWGTQENKVKFVIASFFHDITVSQDDAGLECSTSKANYPDEYYNHPTKAVEVAFDICSEHPGVDQIISQHHEKPDGTGFPKGANAKFISPQAALFIVVHFFCCRMYANRFNPYFLPEAISYLEATYNTGFFEKVAQNFVLMFSEEIPKPQLSKAT
ncbi:MAG: hypothetical protein HOM21_03035 [Halobacteriovoraceae bacterium]|nr:hypothetical protein [Halobacteriovoraceae bacterium]